MSLDPLSTWLATILLELPKEAVKSSAHAFGKWWEGPRGGEAKAINAALPLAMDDFARFGDQLRSEQFRKFMNERQAANDTIFGDALLRALIVDQSGVTRLSIDLRSTIPPELYDAALEFLQHFHRRLWAQPPFDKLLEAQVAQGQLRAAAPPDLRAEEQQYLTQLIANTELLDFGGIPDPRQNAAIRLEDIFIPLGAEEVFEQEPPALEEMSNEEAKELLEALDDSAEWDGVAPTKEPKDLTKVKDEIDQFREKYSGKMIRRVRLDNTLRLN